MGIQQTKGTKQIKETQRKQITQFQIEVAILKIKGYVELNQEKKTNQGFMKEKDLNEMLRRPTRILTDEYQKFKLLIEDVRFIETCNIIINYCNIVKDQSARICKCSGDFNKIPELLVYIESILFAAFNLNLEQVKEFKDLMVNYFGPVFNDSSKLKNVDQRLKNLYKATYPDANEINEFAIKFANKYGLSEKQLNAPGHKFSTKLIQPIQECNQLGAQAGCQNFGMLQDFGNQTQAGFGNPTLEVQEQAQTRDLLNQIQGSNESKQGFGNQAPIGFGNYPQGFANNFQNQPFQGGLNNQLINEFYNNSSSGQGQTNNSSNPYPQIITQQFPEPGKFQQQPLGQQTNIYNNNPKYT